MDLNLKKKILKYFIEKSQNIALFKARGKYSFSTTKLDIQDKYFNSSVEYKDSDNFVKNIKHIDFISLLHAKKVLDFGSGYGGRTLWYADHADHVEGIEIFPNMVELSKDYATQLKKTNVNFTKGFEDRISFPDNYFDIVISFDVLEHVQHPDLIMGEINRVIKPNGLAIIIFTPYYGLFSHHLNYITMLPGLHYFFSPNVIVSTINELLRDEKFKYLNIKQQPLPKLSFNGKREVLPTLNGITKPDYIKIIKELNFNIEYLRSTPLLEVFNFFGLPGILINNILNKIPRVDEFFSHNLVSVLRKRL